MKFKLAQLLNCLDLLPLLLLLLLAEPFESARSRSSSYRSSYRSYRGSSSSSISRNRYGSTRGTGYSTLSQLVANRFSYRTSLTAYRRGIIFAPWVWRQSHADYSRDSATLCFNVQDSVLAQYNSSVLEPWLYQNRTVYGLFVCPMEAGRTDRTYCCGDEDREVCCSFWEEPGRVAGLIIGLIVGIGSCIFGAFRLYHVCSRRYCGSSSQQVQSTAPVSTDLGADSLGPQAYPDAGPVAAAGVDFNKHEEPMSPQPPGYYSYEQPDQSPAALPYPPPTLAPPPDYWEASRGGNRPHQLEPLPPVLH